MLSRCQLAARRHCAAAVSVAAAARVSPLAFAAGSRAASSRASGGPSAGAAAGKLNALAAAIKQIEASFGKGAVMQLGSSSTAPSVEVISTGSLTIDHALGVGGLPRGRVVEIYGPESSGKTTVALHVLAQAQKAGLSCCFIDAEHALDPAYARAVGVNLDALYLSQPDTGEQALEIADTLTRSGAMDVIVVDSVAALVPKAEIEGDMGDHHMALQARLMSQALRKLTASLSRAKTLIIFINQIRSKVGVMFGNPDVTPGGNALKFYASVRMEIRRTGQIKKGDQVVGNETRVKIAKNKMAPPFRVAEFEMTYGHGISRAGEAVDMGVAAGVLKRSGAWYSIQDPTLLAAVNAALRADAVAAAMGGAGAADGDAADADAAAAAAAAAQAAAAAAAPAAGGKSKKGKKGAAAAAPPADMPAPAAAPAAPAPPAAPSAAAAAGIEVDAPVIELGEPFMNGKERMRGFFETHPDALEAAVAVVKRALKAAPGAADGGAAALGGKAKPAPAAAAAAVDVDAALGGGLGAGVVGAIDDLSVSPLGQEDADPLE